MKHTGLVVEIAPKNKVIIMTAQGEFIKVPFRKHVHVGQEVRYTVKREYLNPWQIGLVATLFLVLIGTWPLVTKQLVPANVVPAFVITLDINPSLELQISDKREILSIEGLNSDGEKLVSKLSVVGEDLRSGLAQITKQVQKEGYLKSGQNKVIVTIASQQDQDATVMELRTRRSGQDNELEQIVVEAFSANQLAQVRVWQVPLALQKEAKLAGITPSRYIAIQMPSQTIIPQRLETRLTMNDLPGPEEQPNTLARAIPLQVDAQQVRPALTPVQWTKQTVVNRTTDLYNVSFPIAAQAKGEFRLYQ